MLIKVILQVLMVVYHLVGAWGKETIVVWIAVHMVTQRREIVLLMIQTADAVREVRICGWKSQ